MCSTLDVSTSEKYVVLLKRLHLIYWVQKSHFQHFNGDDKRDKLLPGINASSASEYTNVANAIAMLTNRLQRYAFSEHELSSKKT